VRKIEGHYVFVHLGDGDSFKEPGRQERQIMVEGGGGVKGGAESGSAKSSKDYRT